MIVGLGSDIVNIERIEKLLKKFPERFNNRIFTKTEQNFFKKIIHKDKKLAYCAKRFAAKEACSKPIGTGIRSYVSYLGIEILNNNRGKPKINLLGKTKEYVDNNVGNYQIHITMSDDYPIAFATVVIEAI